MDATTIDRANPSYHGPAPLLIVGSSDRALEKARYAIDAFGLRVGAELPVESALERVERQAATSLIWIEIDEDGEAAMDSLLARVSSDASDGRYAAVVSTIPELLDPVMAGIGASPIEVVVDADAIERTAALAIATAGRAVPYRVSDVAADNGAEQLRHLSEEVNRIASMLARLSNGPAAVGTRTTDPIETANAPPVDAETVRKVIRARRMRARHFPEHLFADPAWDMLLDLLQAELAHLRVPVSSLCIAAAVPATTALRWLKTMVSEGLFVRHADPHDGRRVFVELAPPTRDALHRYFADVEAVCPI